MKKLSAKQIIEETARTYTLANRATNGAGNCIYQTSDGRSCAVGRCLMKRFRNPFLPDTMGVGRLVNHFEKESVDELVFSRYRGHSRDFWVALQSFHDNKDNWTATGLSERGEEFKKNLIKRFS